MISLSELQSLFGAAMRKPESQEILSHIMRKGLDARQRLSVYKNTFSHAVVNSLELTFPAVHRLVGQAFFEMAALAFLQDYPPRDAWLDSFGHDFPRFIGSYRPAASLPYLADVARLELMVCRALRSVDSRRIDPAELAALNDWQAERVMLDPCASLGFLHTLTPADEIWSAVMSESDDELGKLIADSGPAWLIVARDAGVLRVERLPRDAWHFAKALAEGLEVGHAADLVSLDAFEQLNHHLQRHHFRSFSIAGDSLSSR